MVSAMFCSLVAALMARRLRVPTVVLQMPQSLPASMAKFAVLQNKKDLFSYFTEH